MTCWVRGFYREMLETILSDDIDHGVMQLAK
jgi:hypothetical protein